MFIDFYNFRQLEKVKNLIKNSPKNNEIFYTLKDFNKIYDVNIKPIQNCYYLNNYKK